MKILALFMLTSAIVCHGAAEPHTSSNTPPKSVIEVIQHTMPYKIATKGKLTCLIADPTLLNNLPEDFAEKILTEVTTLSACITSASFEEALFEAYKKHLKTDDLKIGISSVQLALLIGSEFGVAHIFHNKAGAAFHLYIYQDNAIEIDILDDHYIPFKSQTEEDVSRSVEEFHKQKHMRLLLARGEKEVVAELTTDFLNTRNNDDFVIKINPTGSPAMVKISTIAYKQGI